ncbi:hypothetical protein TcasGA2_TC033568 [Tribolium castaneum]|uniref:Uncharacterized protein n=1 Tax=Tribolium castaneum TaxID=7070 RepID=A0A139WF43_TRICA|nr:hypothetical protein TcasGA2_TC033568 [Tribolium castaneum]
MSFGKRFIRFCNENVVLIAGVGIIISIHWTWNRLQNIPTLVDPSEKKEMPVILAARYLKRKSVEKYHELTGTEPKEQ